MAKIVSANRRRRTRRVLNKPLYEFRIDEHNFIPFCEEENNTQIVLDAKIQYFFSLPDSL